MVTLFGGQICGRFTIARVIVNAGVPMPMVMDAINHRNRALAAMRRDRPGMKASDNQGQKAEKGDKMPHEAPVSAVNRQCIACLSRYRTRMMSADARPFALLTAGGAGGDGTYSPLLVS